MAAKRTINHVTKYQIVESSSLINVLSNDFFRFISFVDREI